MSCDQSSTLILHSRNHISTNVRMFIRLRCPSDSHLHTITELELIYFSQSTGQNVSAVVVDLAPAQTRTKYSTVIAISWSDNVSVSSTFDDDDDDDDLT